MGSCSGARKNEGLDVGEKIIEAVLGKTSDTGQKFEGDLSRFAGVWKGSGRGTGMELTFAVDSAGNLTALNKGAKKPDTLRALGGEPV